MSIYFYAVFGHIGKRPTKETRKLQIAMTEEAIAYAGTFTQLAKNNAVFAAAPTVCGFLSFCCGKDIANCFFSVLLDLGAGYKLLYICNGLLQANCSVGNAVHQWSAYPARAEQVSCIITTPARIDAPQQNAKSITFRESFLNNVLLT